MPEATTTAERPAAAASGQPLLAVSGLEGWYGESHVLHGVTFDVRDGEVVTLLGRNCAGKTSPLTGILAILTRRQGPIVFADPELTAPPARPIHRPGTAYR